MATIEKECYAIVYALHKFDYLIRDRQFTLRTDHENLTYLNKTPSEKVVRWKLRIQEYDFFLEYIKGELNVVADGMSRLLPTTSEEINFMTVATTLATMTPISEEILNIINVEHSTDNTSNTNDVHTIRIPADRYRVISSVHNSNVGHHGVDRTYNKIKAIKKEWPLMRTHIREFIKQCPCCQKMSQIKVPIHTQHFTTASYEPFAKLMMDTLSFEVPDIDGYDKLLVIIDCFSRWTELYPIKDLSAETAANVLWSYFGRHGLCSQMVSDNSTQFKNALHKELYRLSDIEHLLTCPHSHEENAIIERENKEIVRHVRAIVFDKDIVTEWTRTTPLVERIINSEPVDAIKASPAEILGINLDRHIFNSDAKHNDTPEKLSTWVANRLQLQHKVTAAAKKYQLQKDTKHMAGKNPQLTAFAVNSYVLVEYPDQKIRRGHPTDKLRLPLKGPMKVIKRINPNSYQLKDLSTDKYDTVHITRIRQFFFDPARINPYDIARRDRGEIYVDHVVEHSGTSSKKKEMQFRVRWTGCSSNDDRWLNWSEVRDLQQLHKYLFHNNMANLIDKKHRQNSYD